VHHVGNYCMVIDDV